MKNIKVILLVKAGACLVVLMISGCSSGRFSLVDQGLVSVENQASEKVEILWTDVYREGDETIIYGALQQRGQRMYPVKAHVDITVRAEDGSIRQELRSDDIDIPRRRVGKGPDWKRFKVRVPHCIAKGSAVNMVVHSGSHVQVDIRDETDGGTLSPSQ